MEINEYQRAARETSQLRLGGPHSAVAPMLGLASETGAILNVYKKYLRDGIDLVANREFLREELGDLLWYVAAVATACDLDLDEVAVANLDRTHDRYPRRHDLHQPDELPVFDACYPLHERFPRRVVVAFAERPLPSGRASAVRTLVSAEPNVFPEGPMSLNGGKLAGFQVSTELGDVLPTTPGVLTPTDSMTPSIWDSWPCSGGRPRCVRCCGSSVDRACRCTLAPRYPPDRVSQRDEH